MRKMTEKSLGEAFAGESMAHMKYLAFSEAAEREGKPNVARLFRAIAYAEQVHATNHARNLGYIKDTLENLEAAIGGENFEVTEMYPAYQAIAELQDEKGAQTSIRYAVEAEKIHEALYTEAKEAVKNGGDADIGDIYICPICGYTHVGTPPEKCPICNAPSEKFKKF
ncbi:MAG: rubrerythrin family protein [Thermoplasmata archaeon]|nr:rubrerythrin family protein [Thermoplasmata archaeon]